jgi:hypothetical protein
MVHKVFPSRAEDRFGDDAVITMLPSEAVAIAKDQ